MDIAESLKTFLASGGDWERKNTSVPGISIIRLPKTRNRPASLGIEINPLGKTGTPMKKRGLLILSAEEVLAFRELFGNEKLHALIQAIETVIPERTRAEKIPKGDVIEL